MGILPALIYGEAVVVIVTIAVIALAATIVYKLVRSWRAK